MGHVPLPDSTQKSYPLPFTAKAPVYVSMQLRRITAPTYPTQPIPPVLRGASNGARTPRGGFAALEETAVYVFPTPSPFLSFPGLSGHRRRNKVGRSRFGESKLEIHNEPWRLYFPSAARSSQKTKKITFLLWFSISEEAHSELLKGSSGFTSRPLKELRRAELMPRVLH